MAAMVMKAQMRVLVPSRCSRIFLSLFIFFPIVISVNSPMTGWTIGYIPAAKVVLFFLNQPFFVHFFFPLVIFSLFDGFLFVISENLSTFVGKMVSPPLQI